MTVSRSLPFGADVHYLLFFYLASNAAALVKFITGKGFPPLSNISKTGRAPEFRVVTVFEGVLAVGFSWSSWYTHEHHKFQQHLVWVERKKRFSGSRFYIGDKDDRFFFGFV